MSKRRRKWHNPEQIVRKLRDADAMLNAGKDLAAVLQAWEVSATVKQNTDGIRCYLNCYQTATFACCYEIDDTQDSSG